MSDDRSLGERMIGSEANRSYERGRLAGLREAVSLQARVRNSEPIAPFVPVVPVTKRATNAPPPVGTVALCPVCAYAGPWGTWGPHGIVACVRCRDAGQEAARAAYNSAARESSAS